MTIMKRIFTALSILAASVSLYAQEAMNSAYFLDGYSFRHEYNPAFVSARNYIALPAIGSVNLSLNSNLGLRTFLYPLDNGKLGTFMHPEVTPEEFKKNIRRNNNLCVGASTKILSIGAWGKHGGFTTVGIDLKANAGANIPGSLFEFMKNPGASQTYNVDNLGLNINSYLQIAVGHSRKIGEKLNVGAKVKFLVGLAAADVNIDKMELSMKQDKWSVTAQGGARISSGKGLLTVGTTEDGQLDFTSAAIDPMNALRENGVNGLLGGYGAAIDLGATYEILDGLTVSASVLDLGFLRWNSSIYAKADGISWEFEGFEDVDPNAGMNDQITAIAEDFAEMLVMRKDSEGPSTQALTCKVNAGIEYKMPFWKGLSVGALYSGRYNGAYTFNEGRLAVNLALGNVFSLSGSYGISNFGQSVGAALNLHFIPFQLYVATDALFWDVTAPVAKVGNFAIGLPYKNANLCLHLGLLLQISKRKDKLHKRY